MAETDGRIYEGDVGVKFIVNTGVDLTAATGLYVKTKDPNGLEATWVASMSAASSYKIEYTTVFGDLGVSGTWKARSFVEFGADSVHNGKVFKFKVWDVFK